MPDFITQVDETIIFWVQTHLHNAFTDPFFSLITHLGDAGLIWIVLGVCLLIPRRSRWWGALLLIGLVSSYVIGDLLVKNLVARPRPCHDFPEITLLISQPSSYSFPSGHSFSSMTCACLLCRFHKKAGAAAVVLALLIAFSRIFLFVHYPFDVFTGLVLGLLWSLLLWKLVLFSPLRHHFREEKLTVLHR